MSYLGITPGVSEGFPAECIELGPYGWVWKCGEPVPEAVREMIDCCSDDPDPIRDTVVPPEPNTPGYVPAPPETPGPGPDASPQDPYPTQASIGGFGLVGWLVAGLFAVAMSGRT